MSYIDLNEAIDVEYAMRAYDYHLAAYTMREGTFDEIYYAPDMKAALVLRDRGGIPWGCMVYSAEVRALQDGRVLGPCAHRFWLRRFFSPGGFGSMCAYWSGSPWSPNSKYIVLGQVFGKMDEGCKIRIIEHASGRSRVLLKSRSGARHHEWSPNSAYSLIASTGKWLLHTQKTGQLRVIYEGRPPQRHCHFDNSGEVVVLLDDDCVVRAMECNSLSEVCRLCIRQHLKEGESVNYSMVDPWEDRVLLGVNASLDNRLSGGKWLAVGLKP